jgi:hypothetical protein
MEPLSCYIICQAEFLTITERKENTEEELALSVQSNSKV